MEVVGNLGDAQLGSLQQERGFHQQHLIDIVDNCAARDLTNHAGEIDCGDKEFVGVERDVVVFYKVAGDINHKDEEGSYIILAIEKAAGAYTVTYKGEEGEVLATEQVDLHFPEAPVVAEKTFTGWTIETVDESALVLRTVYVFGDPKDVANLPTSQSPAKIIKGQHVYILRGDKTYTIDGREVK